MRGWSIIGAVGLALLVLLGLAAPLPSIGNTAPLGAAVTRSSAGADAASITPAVNQFRADLGGQLNPNVAQTFATGRREINWDGVPDQFSAPNNLPPNFFNVNSLRGVIFSTPGGGLQVSSSIPGQERFANINSTYPNILQVFSAPRLFTALGSNVTEVTFFLPGTTTPATVSGFGSVFTDVDTAGSTTIEYFAPDGTSLGLFPVPPAPGNQTLSFLGVSFNAGERIARVRITSGNVAPGPNDNPPTADVVVMDDFIYGEPQPLPPVTATPTAQADLAITKTDTPDPVTAGQNITYTMVATNQGPAATAVTFTDTLPANTTFVSLNAPGTWSCTLPAVGATGTISCTTLSLAAGGSATFTLIVQVNPNTPNGTTITNTATVFSSTPDSNSANNSATTTTTVNPATPIRPPLIIPLAPPPPFLLPPPPPPVMPMQQPQMAPRPPTGPTLPEVPVIPEADSLILLGMGLAVAGALVGVRSLRRRKQ